jgi:phospholipid-binding lipoprotein MlaA
MKRIFITIVILVFTSYLFSGCSSKVEPSKNTQVTTEVKTENTVLEEDEFLDEFADEMKIEKRSDPFSGYNRLMTSFNDGAYEYVFAPTARGYRFVVHQEIRSSIGKFFHNILYPIRLVNNLLQGKIKNSAEETGRFVINTTIGMLGLFDPATSYFNLEAHNEDFGQTLGYWGVGPGPHIVLPFMGPSNLRDALSLYPDSLLNPVDYHDDRKYNITNDFGESLVIKTFDKINYLSLHLGEYEKLKKDAIDLYPYLRDVYEQRREKQIKE